MAVGAHSVAERGHPEEVINDSCRRKGPGCGGSYSGKGFESVMYVEKRTAPLHDRLHNRATPFLPMTCLKNQEAQLLPQRRRIASIAVSWPAAQSFHRGSALRCGSTTFSPLAANAYQRVETLTGSPELGR